MAKPTINKKIEGTKYFNSIYKGNNTLSKIIKDLNLDIVAPVRENSKPNRSGQVDKRYKGKTTNNLTNKLTSIVEMKLISKTGERKGTKYSISEEGVFKHWLQNYLPEWQRAGFILELENKTIKQQENFKKLIIKMVLLKTHLNITLDEIFKEITNELIFTGLKSLLD